MEAILNSLADGKRKIYIEWKQVAGAILMAFAVAILCIYVSDSKDDFSYKVKPVVGTGSTEKTFQIKAALNNLKLININESNQLPHQNSISKDSQMVIPEMSVVEDYSLNTSVKTKTEKLIQKDSDGKDMQKQIEINSERKVSEIKHPKESVKSEKEDVALISGLSLELYGNGGLPECQKDSCNLKDFDIGKYEEPERLGKLFDGWYLDQDCSTPFYSIEENVTSLKLYAGWKEFPGFISNDKGHIIGYTDTSRFLGDNLMVLPSYKTCTGIEKDAINGLEDEIYEIYIPANITYIEMDIFNKLPNLFYIQVQSGNPEFYSENGKLYYKNGKLAATPKGLE
ncbi:MAG: hypothetical protein ACI4S2_09755 [Lachnospiraceae bacterium]